MKPGMLSMVMVIAVVVEAMVAVAALVLSLITFCRPGPPSTDPMRELIAMEATAALQGDVDKAVDLYAPNAVVRDGRGEIGKALGIVPSHVQSTWSGLDEIRDRYTHLERFNELQHVDVTVTFEQGGQVARAVGSTSGEMVNADGTTTPISSIDGEMWTFQKIDGAWKIISFTYNAR